MSRSEVQNDNNNNIKFSVNSINNIKSAKKSGNLKDQKLFKSQKLSKFQKSVKSEKSLLKNENLPNFNTKKNKLSFLTLKLRWLLIVYS